MNVHMWVAYQLLIKHCNAYVFFTECYNEIYPMSKGKGDSRISRHATYYDQKKLVPHINDCEYVHRCYEREQKKLWSIPFKAAQPVRLGFVGKFVPVDDGSPILYPHKERDGVWRC